MVFFCERELPRAETDSFLFAWTRVVGLDKGRSLRDDNIYRDALYQDAIGNPHGRHISIQCKYVNTIYQRGIQRLQFVDHISESNR